MKEKKGEKNEFFKKAKEPEYTSSLYLLTH